MTVKIPKKHFIFGESPTCFIIWCGFCSPPCLNITSIHFTNGMKGYFVTDHNVIKKMIINLNFVYHVFTQISVHICFSPSFKACIICSLYGLNASHLHFPSVNLGIFNYKLAYFIGLPVLWTIACHTCSIFTSESEGLPWPGVLVLHSWLQ